MVDRCRCGYLRDVHEPDTGRCPLCQCGAPSGEHVPMFDPPAPALAAEYKSIAAHCPGKRPGRPGGAWPALRRGSFVPPPVMTRYETRPQWGPILFPVTEVVEDDAEPVEVAVGPPLIPARPPYGPGEIAGYQRRQAIGLGQAATLAGWTVRALYWLAADEEEGCAVQLRRDDLRAAATWLRPAGHRGAKSGWRADLAYAWRQGAMPTKVTHERLLELVKNA